MNKRIKKSVTNANCDHKSLNISSTIKTYRSVINLYIKQTTLYMFFNQKLISYFLKLLFIIECVQDVNAFNFT